MLKNLKNKKKKGFTLIELIIVIAIIAILAAIALPRLSGFTTSAKQKADLSSAKTIANAVTILEAQDENLGLTSTPVNVSTISKLAGYLQSIPKDSAGKEFKVGYQENSTQVIVQDSSGKQLFPNTATPTE